MLTKSLVDAIKFWSMQVYTYAGHDVRWTRRARASAGRTRLHCGVLIIVVTFLVQSPNLSHPFHLHGAPYNVIGIGRSPDKNVKKINLKHALDLDRKGLLKRQYNLPPFKDTIAVPNNGYVVLRLKADNPGAYSLLLFLNLIRNIVLVYLIIIDGNRSFPSLGTVCDLMIYAPKTYKYTIF